MDSTFFSVVPNNSLGKSAVRMLRSNDVHCTPMILSTPEETATAVVLASSFTLNSETGLCTAVERVELR